jgi:hypothetical protein
MQMNTATTRAAAAGYPWRLARGLLGDPVEQAGTEEIDDDRDDDDEERGGGGRHRMGAGCEQARDGFPDHPDRKPEQQRGLRQRRDALDLAVTVVMLLVRGLAGDAHGEIGHHRGDEVDQRMRRFGQHRQRARGESDHALGERQPAGRGNRPERDPFLVVHARTG